MRPPPGYPAAGDDLASATLAALITIATAAASSDPHPHVHPSSSSSSSSHNKPDNGECSLLGPFAILVQGALGLLAMSALVYKRWRERPQRPVKIWAFDASKQIVGSVLVHIANLGMSLLSSGQFDIKVQPSLVAMAMRRRMEVEGVYTPNPCSFYLLNLAIDTTIGIPILIILLRILTALFTYTPFGQPPESIASGNYGTPPRAMWWFKQSIIYFLGLMGMKICVLIIFLALPWISKVGDWALRWTEGNEALQVVFVMLVFPLIMNATQYYIIDTFIKNQKPGEFEVLPDSEDTDEEGGLLGGDEEVDDEEVAAKEVEVETVKHKRAKNGSGSGNYSPLKSAHGDYDPMVDGQNSPASSSKTAEHGKSGSRG